MRKPRPEDYDPNYTEKTTGPKPEAIDMAGVVPIKAKGDIMDSQKQTQTERSTVRKSERHGDRTGFRSDNRSSERSVYRTVFVQTERPTKRHSFEFYKDQIEKLGELETAAKKDGRRLNRSALARAALDEYFENHGL